MDQCVLINVVAGKHEVDRGMKVSAVERCDTLRNRKAVPNDIVYAIRQEEVQGLMFPSWSSWCTTRAKHRKLVAFFPRRQIVNAGRERISEEQLATMQYVGAQHAMVDVFGSAKQLVRSPRVR